MKTYVYWNTNDNDCKKLFHFMSEEDDYSAIPFLEEKSALTVNRIWRPFSDKTQILQDIRENDLIIFLTHGEEECILKYRNDPNRNYMDYILISRDDADVLRGKVVLAFCCSSARGLGRYCVEPDVGCKAYVGFESDIVYDNGRAKRSRHLIYESYKIAISRSLQYAANTHCSVEKYCIKLIQFLRFESVKAILEADDQTLHNMYSGTIGGIVALGEQEATVFI